MVPDTREHGGPHVDHPAADDLDGSAQPTGLRAVPDHKAGLDALTVREREVLLLLADGLSNIEIARELFLSEATVKSHVARLLMKLGVRDRVQAVVAAFRAGIVLPPGR